MMTAKTILIEAHFKQLNIILTRKINAILKKKNPTH